MKTTVSRSCVWACACMRVCGGEGGGREGKGGRGGGQGERKGGRGEGGREGGRERDLGVSAELSGGVEFIE
jgi:hypothetical protein